MKLKEPEKYKPKLAKENAAYMDHWNGYASAEPGGHPYGYPLKKNKPGEDMTDWPEDTGQYSRPVQSFEDKAYSDKFAKVAREYVARNPYPTKRKEI